MHDARHAEETESTRLTDVVRRRDRRYVWHPWSPLTADRARLTLSHGDGYRVWDIDGKEYVDASSLNATCGYGHPALAAAVGRQLLRLHGTDLSVASHEPAGLLAERLARFLPDGLSKTLFVNSGSEGFEAAIFIAASYWAQIGQRRSRVVAFSRGYHGTTLISRSLGGLAGLDHPFRPPLPVTHVELPLPPKELRRPESLKCLLDAFGDAIEGSANDPPMAVVVEPFMNVGGGVVLPQGFLRGLRRLCDNARTLLIVDEVFTGYGRSGKMFAFQREGIAPDILVSSKGLGSGYMPITAVTVQERIHDTFVRDPILGGLRYGHTTSGHAVSCAAALATLDLLESGQLAERAERHGKVLLDKIRAHEDAPDVVDVRGFGLVIVLQMNSEVAASRLVSRAESKGLLLRQNGEVVMVVPPLTIDSEGIDAIAERFGGCFAGA